MRINALMKQQEAMEKQGVSLDIDVDIKHPLLRQVLCELALRKAGYTARELEEMNDKDFDLLAEIILSFRPVSKLMSTI